ncbi:Zn-ribbon domain-containing OB-fold protein [Jatrophihabitans sp. DSM 45814]
MSDTETTQSQLTPAQSIPPGVGVYPSPMSDPYADELTQPFWDAALRGQLVAPKCTNCGTFILPPQPRCFVCQNDRFDYVDLPGTGVVYSFTIVRHPLAPHLREVVPYVSAVIQVDGTQGAGARLLLNVINVEPETVKVGDKVRIIFDKISDTLAIPRAVPA